LFCGLTGNLTPVLESAATSAAAGQPSQAGVAGMFKLTKLTFV